MAEVRQNSLKGEETNMAKLTFQGGIHPYDGKDLSKDKPIVELKAGPVLVFPLSQHIGAPAKPLVQKGDYVYRGQKIAEAGSFVSFSITMLITMSPEATRLGSMAFTVPETEEWIFADTKDPASAIFCPR